MSVSLLLTELLNRMPELEWQLSKLGNSFSPRVLPRGLFQQRLDAPIQSYLAEIKTNISMLLSLESDSNQQKERYLTLKIDQKIEVLVRLCARYKKQTSASEEATFNLDTLSTRMQHLRSFELNIQTLTEQREALVHTLAKKEKSSSAKKDIIVLLTLRHELSRLEKKLTLARETYASMLD